GNQQRGPRHGAGRGSARRRKRARRSFAGRALAQINSLIISEEAGLTRQQVRDFEKRVGSLTLDEKTRLQKTLESYGVVFIAEEDESGHGVRCAAAKMATDFIVCRWNGVRRKEHAHIIALVVVDGSDSFLQSLRVFFDEGWV